MTDPETILINQTEPYLFLLEKDKQLVFRSIGFPFKFNGGLLDSGEFVVCDVGNPHYVIFGVDRIEKTYGFLLINETVFSKVLGVFKSNNLIGKKINRDLIFYYSQFADGSFRVFLNPEEDLIMEDYAEIFKDSCESKKFIERSFNKGDVCAGVQARSLLKDSFKIFKNGRDYV
jgi:hypothetical protein